MVDDDVHAKLESWRAQGHDRFNAMRFRIMEALVRRASVQEGETRRLLDARLSGMVSDYARDIESRIERVEAPHASVSLALLLDELNQRAESHQPPEELIDHLRGVWAKVSAEKRVRESLARVPKNAGPLNSDNLVHRSLALMREVSPGYLQHFLGYLDALSWMDALTSAPAVKKPARPKRNS